MADSIEGRLYCARIRGYTVFLIMCSNFLILWIVAALTFKTSQLLTITLSYSACRNHVIMGFLFYGFTKEVILSHFREISLAQSTF